MARGRKAVNTGSSRKQPARNCRQAASAEAAAPSQAAKPSLPMDPKPKRNPRRAAKDRWEEEKLMTSDKSQLIDIDLTKLLLLPGAWSCLEESEKKEILALLPSDTHPNPDPPPDDPDAKIPPIPEGFLRYSNDWRDGLRNFQLDLQNGHYDPVWIREAEEAVQQRAAGKFDKFKEQEFEEFWGQKQKMDRNLAAGDSSKVRLSQLAEHGYVQTGDVWKWSRTFSKQKLFIEKEARIVDIDGGRLTFAVPPGQRVFLKANRTPEAKDMTSQALDVGPNTPPLSPENGATVVDMTADSDAKETEAGSSRKRSAEPEVEITSVKRARGRPRKQQPEPEEEQAHNVTVEIQNPPHEAEMALPVSRTKDHAEEYVKPKAGNNKPVEPPTVEQLPALEEDSHSAPQTNGEPEEVLIPNIQGPTALTSKILEVDGRIKNVPNGNAWKEIRCHRDNQDIGGLWEIRHAWYLKYG